MARSAPTPRPGGAWLTCLIVGAASLMGGCSLLAAPGPSSTARALPPTPKPAFGLTWAIADVERPADAFAISSNPATGPEHPNTAGHPGHFPGQAVIADVAVSGQRLVAVGFVGIDGTWRADAWSSTDGRTWAVHPIDEASWTFAVAIAVAPDGTFVAVGRKDREAAAWRSPDGIAWTPATVGSLEATEGDATGSGTTSSATGSAAPTRPLDQAERMTTIVSTDRGLVAGGSVGPELGDRHARLWRSADGLAWQPVPDDPGAFAGAEVAAIEWTATGYVALGRLGTGGRATGSIAWRSSDGLAWTRVDDPALASGLAVSLVMTPAGLLAVGSDGDEREAVAWSSVDGASWTRAPSEPARLHFGEKIRMTDVVVTPSGYVAVGNYVGVQFGTGTSWLSADGLHWTQAPDQPTLGQAEPEAVVAWRDRLVIVGSRGAPDNYIPSVWLSPGLP
ncbi:MAG: hypothetical protein HY263_01625 [Chloroflexi bacterium]|nr:hypothetical protein [Chloroflexota bacterium]